MSCSSIRANLGHCIDKILGIREQIGAQLADVDLVERTWSGKRQGDGTFTDVVTRLSPAPEIVDYSHNIRTSEAGAVKSGDLILRGISPKYTEDQKKKFFQWAFGWFDIGLFQELTNKFKMAHSTSDSDQDFGVMPSLASLIQPNVINSPAPEVDKTKAKLQQTIKEIVKEILEEFMPPPSMTPSGDATSSGDNGLPGESERRKDTMLKRQDAMKKKAASERDLKTLQADLKWKESDVKKKRKDEIPNKRDEIDSLNKMAAAGSSP